MEHTKEHYNALEESDGGAKAIVVADFKKYWDKLSDLQKRILCFLCRNDSSPISAIFEHLNPYQPLNPKYSQRDVWDALNELLDLYTPPIKNASRYYRIISYTILSGIIFPDGYYWLNVSEYLREFLTDYSSMHNWSRENNCWRREA